MAIKAAFCCAFAAIAASKVNTRLRLILPMHTMPANCIVLVKGFFFFIVGGFLVGFGTRYAGGCTSGHSIMGLSNLQWPSLVATIAFMVGGFVSANFILPVIFKLLQ